MDTQEVKEPEKIKEPQTSSEKKEADSEQITTTTKQTVPKNPGRIAAGKKLAEHNKKAREAKKKAKEVTRTDTKRGEQKENPPSTENESEQSSSFSLTQVLSVASIVVSLVGLYYKREELKHLFKNESKVGSERSERERERTEKAQKQLIDHMTPQASVRSTMVEVERQNVTEAATKKSPKLKQMD